MLDVTLPGVGGTTPRVDRHLSCAYFRCDGHGLLIDCGEGTQIAIKKAGFLVGRIGMILLTHFHADHVAGLPGLLLTMGNEGRREPVVIAGPRGVTEIVRSLTVICRDLPFRVECRPLDDFDTLSFHDFSITAFALHHTCPCLGYDVRVSRAGRFHPDRAKAAGIPVMYWKRLQNGETVTAADGSVFTPSMVLGDARRGLHVTYATDTRPCSIISTMAANADLLILEGMFGDEEKDARAREVCHMTIRDAVRLIREAEPRAAWLTHFSPSMPAPHIYADQLAKDCPNARIAHDGIQTTLLFDDET